MSNQLETARCGCRYGIIDDTFVLEACEDGTSCPTVKFVIAETLAAEHPLTVVEETVEEETPW